jgi:hypothetical protein
VLFFGIALFLGGSRMAETFATIGFLLAMVAFFPWAVYWGTIVNCRDELQHDDRRRDRDNYGRYDDPPPPPRDAPEQIEDRYR